MLRFQRSTIGDDCGANWHSHTVVSLAEYRATGTPRGTGEHSIEDHGWAAGCVFRYTADETILDEFARPTGTSAYSFVNDANLAPAVVLFVEGDTKASGSNREHIPDAVSFCYVPE